MQLDKFEGSIEDFAEKSGQDTSLILMSAENVVLLDVSSSMSANAESGKSKWDEATIQLKNIQKEYPGNVALFCFDDETTFHENGIPRKPDGCTYLFQAINFVADLLSEESQRLFVITDGEVFDKELALEVAGKLPCVINSIFIGDAYNQHIEAFLTDLCKSNGKDGKNVYSREVKGLGEAIKMLMPGK